MWLLGHIADNFLPRSLRQCPQVIACQQELPPGRGQETCHPPQKGGLPGTAAACHHRKGASGQLQSMIAALTCSCQHFRTSAAPICSCQHFRSGAAPLCPCQHFRSGAAPLCPCQHQGSSANFLRLCQLLEGSPGIHQHMKGHACTPDRHKKLRCQEKHQKACSKIQAPCQHPEPDAHCQHRDGQGSEKLHRKGGKKGYPKHPQGRFAVVPCQILHLPQGGSRPPEQLQGHNSLHQLIKAPVQLRLPVPLLRAGTGCQPAQKVQHDRRHRHGDKGDKAADRIQI